MLRRTISNLPTLIVLALISLMAFNAMAFAQGTVAPSDGSILDIVKPVFNAFSGGHYAYAGALLVIALVALLKQASARYLGTKIVTFLHGNTGGTLLALVAAMATAVATALATPDAHVTLALLKSSFLVGIGAAGGYAVLKNLVIEPILKPLVAKYPKLAPLLTVASWIFDKPDLVAQAEKAGQAAVDAKPAPGAAAVIGQPTELK